MGQVGEMLERIFFSFFNKNKIKVFKFVAHLKITFSLKINEMLGYISYGVSTHIYKRQTFFLGVITILSLL